MDWGDALRSPPALSTATRLTRLVLNNHLATTWGAGGQQLVPPADLAQPLLSAVAAHPTLRRLQDVVERGTVSGLTPPVARAMWELPRAAPHVQLAQLENTYIGWSLASIPAEAAAVAAAAVGV